MSEARGPETPAGSTEDSATSSGALAKTDRRNVSLTSVDTAGMVGRLHSLFDDVMSGRDYDERKVKNATNLTNTMVKVLRFEFDVYKHFARDVKLPADGIVEHDTSAMVADFLRADGDRVEKANGVGMWKVNDRSCTERELVIRANNKRTMRGERPFEIGE